MDRNEVRRCISLAVVFVLLVPVIAIGAKNPKQFQNVSIQSPMEVKRLEEVEGMVDDAIRTQSEVMAGIAERIEEFVRTTSGIGAKVVDATNAWVSAPSPRSEGRVEQTIGEGAAVGREAARSITTLEGDTVKATAAILKGLESNIQEITRTVGQSENLSHHYESEFAKAKEAALKAKEVLEKKGYLATDGQLPPELEKKLFQLAVDYQELEMMSQIWKEVGAGLNGYLAVLEQARTDYKDINNMASMISYQAASMERMFGAVGMAQSLKIKTKLIGDAYGQAAEFHGRVSSALQQLRGIRENLFTLLSGMRGLPKPDSHVAHKKGEDRVSAQGLVDFFKSLGNDGQRIASTNPSEHKE